jgi:DNA-binding CsgD family transcriptional regulator
MDVRTIALSPPPVLPGWEHDGAPAIAVSNNLPHGLPTLTPRERDVLLLLVHRQTDREIAARLGIGRRTVETHVSRILAKLAVPNRRDAAVVALALGLFGYGAE